MTHRPLSLPPLGLYIHIPWCLKKCPYCDFNSHAMPSELPEADYISALLKDLTLDLARVQDRKLSSIFIGGGTPSLFSPAAIARLLDGVQAIAGFTPDIEITMEANPGTFETEKFRGFRNAGINRLSIGIQSFQPAFLKALGRVHNDGEALHAAENVRTAGFDNFNLDLMFGLPGQSVSQAQSDLDSALAFEPPHLSWYQLTIEPNTAFYSCPPPLPEEDSIAEMQEAGINRLEDHGLNRYEISAYSRPGRQSRHNLNYWQFGDYLGIGAGAHGKITLPGEQRIIRTRKTRQPDNYLNNYLSQKKFTVEQADVGAEDLSLEFMMNALRLCDGCDEKVFEERTGLSLATVAGEIEQLRNEGLLRQDRLATTEKGLMYLNNVLERFLDPGAQHPVRIPLNTL